MTISDQTQPIVSETAVSDEERTAIAASVERAERLLKMAFDKGYEVGIERGRVEGAIRLMAFLGSVFTIDQYTATLKFIASLSTPPEKTVVN